MDRGQRETPWPLQTEGEDVGQQLFSSPITYMVDGKQYVTLVAQTDVFTFGLAEETKPVPVLSRKREQ